MIFDLLPLPPNRPSIKHPAALAGKLLELGADCHVKIFLPSLVTWGPLKPARPVFRCHLLGLRS